MQVALGIRWRFIVIPHTYLSSTAICVRHWYGSPYNPPWFDMIGISNAGVRNTSDMHVHYIEMCIDESNPERQAWVNSGFQSIVGGPCSMTSNRCYISLNVHAIFDNKVLYHHAACKLWKQRCIKSCQQCALGRTYHISTSSSCTLLQLLYCELFIAFLSKCWGIQAVSSAASHLGKVAHSRQVGFWGSKRSLILRRLVTCYFLTIFLILSRKALSFTEPILFEGHEWDLK